MTAQDRSTMSVMLTCRDMAASAAFYRDTLGFEMKESWPDETAPMWANMVLHGQSVMIGAAMDPEKVGDYCKGDPQQEAYFRQSAIDFRDNRSGVGIQVYLMVPDVDAYHAELKDRGAAPRTEPISQFYGIRDFGIDDPDGYHLVFFTPIAMESCQSCGMPLAEAQPGQMYCRYCTDDKGVLRPYEQVFEGTVTGYFMGMQKMARTEAEKAAKEHLAKMPAWAGR